MSPSNAETALPAIVLGRFQHFGPGVKPPRQIFAPEPSFNDFARQAKYDGTVILGLTLDEEGLAKDVHITAPLGYGLDENAVHAVQTWKFKPAEKDGQPVRVEIEVEVTFTRNERKGFAKSEY